MTCKDIVNKAHVRVERNNTCKPSPRKADGRLKDFGLALLNMLERSKKKNLFKKKKHRITMMIFHQVENTKREAGVIIQYQLYIMQLQRTEIQTKTSSEK